MLYIRKLLITTFVIFSVVGIINWLIDPFGMYWSPRLDGINNIKPEAGNRSRIVKAYRAIEVSPQVLIVGNSRIEMGLDPKLSRFSASSVYNQGIPGAPLHMQIDYAMNVINQTSSIEEVIMSIDFLDFLIRPGELADQLAINDKPQSYDPHLLTKNENSSTYLLSKYKTYYQLLFSLDSLQASLTTIANQNEFSNAITPDGFNTANGYLKIVKYEGYEPLFSQKLDWLIGFLLSKDWIVFPEVTSPYSPKFEQLNSLINLCKEKGIKLKLFISPYHFSYLHALKQTGYWERFLQWKLALVKFMEQEKHTELALWDFSLINDKTKEKIYQNKDLDWFWEPAHYKSSYGKIIADAIYGKDISEEIGIKLTHENVNFVIENQSDVLNNTRKQWNEIKERLNLSKAF